MAVSENLILCGCSICRSQNFCENSPNYVTIATRIGPRKMAPLIRPSPKNPLWCELGGSSICTSRVMADLYRKWSNFREHGNKGRPNENLNSTIKSAVVENSLFGANSAALAWSYTSTSRVMADLRQKWSKFQNSISQRIFNQSSPDFYPHWTLAVAIQSRCWNYPSTSRFGQTEDKNLGSISSLTWRSRSRSTKSRSARWRPMRPTKFHQNPIINDKVIWILIFRFSGQNGYVTLKSGSRSLKVGQCS